jgi:hypothetical protein
MKVFIRSTVPVQRPMRKRRHVAVRPRADLHQAVELTGKFLGLFVLFTSSMNWWTYRKIRKSKEDKENKK